MKTQERDEDLTSVVRRLGERLSEKSAIGERASLRRLNHVAPDRAEFWKIVVSDLDALIADDEPRRGRDERRWAALLAGLAVVAGGGLYRPGHRLGMAAAEAGLLESRFTKLLRAHDDALLDLIQPLAHQLVAKGEHVDWLDVVRLVLSDGEPGEDQVRRHLAQDYFSTLHKKSHKQEPTA